MRNKNSVLSYALAALAGVCFITGVSLLSSEGSVVGYGPSEETTSNI